VEAQSLSVYEHIIGESFRTEVRQNVIPLKVTVGSEEARYRAGLRPPLKPCMQVWHSSLKHNVKCRDSAEQMNRVIAGPEQSGREESPDTVVVGSQEPVTK